MDGCITCADTKQSRMQLLGEISSNVQAWVNKQIIDIVIGFICIGSSLIQSMQIPQWAYDLLIKSMKPQMGTLFKSICEYMNVGCILIFESMNEEFSKFKYQIIMAGKSHVLPNLFPN